jgi:flavin reductase (DIM6/NTAB) family NADH-FMN oxidoreductase RutF
LVTPASSRASAQAPFVEIPTAQARKFLEPGPVVLLTTRHAGNDNVMTLGWHQVLEFTPSLISCVVSRANRSFEMLRASGECVINVPTADMLDTVVRIGNCSGAEVDKFAAFDLEREAAHTVDAPALAQCHARLECRIHDDRAVERYNLFILEVAHIRARARPRTPDYVHYLGDGEFMLSGKRVSRRRLFRPDMLGA